MTYGARIIQFFAEPEMKMIITKSLMRRKTKHEIIYEYTAPAANALALIPLSKLVLGAADAPGCGIFSLNLEIAYSFV